MTNYTSGASIYCIYDAKYLDENIILVHRTRELIGDTIYPNQMATLKKLELNGSELINYVNSLPPLRLTTHFMANTLVESHKENEFIGHSCAYLIPVNEVKGRIHSIEPEDIQVIGPVKASANSVIIIPITQKLIVEELLSSFTGKIVYYNPISEKLSDVVAIEVRKISKLDIKIDQNQWKKIPIKECEEKFLLAKKNNLLDEYQIFEIHQTILSAKENNKEYIEQPLMLEEKIITVDNKNIKFLEFFSPWIKQGIIPQSHSTSLLSKLEFEQQGTLFWAYASNQYIKLFLNRNTKLNEININYINDHSTIKIKTYICYDQEELKKNKADLIKILDALIDEANKNNRTSIIEALSFYKNFIERFISYADKNLAILPKGHVYKDHKEKYEEFFEVQNLTLPAVSFFYGQCSDITVPESTIVTKCLNEVTNGKFSSRLNKSNYTCYASIVEKQPEKRKILMEKLSKGGIKHLTRDNEIIVPNINTEIVGDKITKLWQEKIRSETETPTNDKVI